MLFKIREASHTPFHVSSGLCVLCLDTGFWLDPLFLSLIIIHFVLINNNSDNFVEHEDSLP